MLIEGATGIYTGSKYNERRIYEENGFLGELENYEKGTTIAIKNHGMGGLEKSGAVLLIMRNPYDAFKAEFNRKQTPRNVDGGRSHVDHADPAGLDKVDLEQSSTKIIECQFLKCFCNWFFLSDLK